MTRPSYLAIFTGLCQKSRRDNNWTDSLRPQLREAHARTLEAFVHIAGEHGTAPAKISLDPFTSLPGEKSRPATRHGYHVSLVGCDSGVLDTEMGVPVVLRGPPDQATVH